MKLPKTLKRTRKVATKKAILYQPKFNQGDRLQVSATNGDSIAHILAINSDDLFWGEPYYKVHWVEGQNSRFYKHSCEYFDNSFN